VITCDHRTEIVAAPDEKLIRRRDERLDVIVSFARTRVYAAARSFAVHNVAAARRDVATPLAFAGFKSCGVGGDSLCGRSDDVAGRVGVDLPDEQAGVEEVFVEIETARAFLRVLETPVPVAFHRGVFRVVSEKKVRAVVLFEQADEVLAEFGLQKTVVGFALQRVIIAERDERANL
jgi:hypothetical protein